MFELLFELLVSVTVCLVAGFFLFLGVAEEEPEMDASGYPYDAVIGASNASRRRAPSSGSTRSGGGALPRLWRQLCRTLHIGQAQWNALYDAYDAAWTALVGTHSVLGRDRDDEATGAIAEILRRRSQLKATRRPSSAVGAAREEDMGEGGVAARKGEAAAGRETKTAPPATNGVVEGTQWLNTLGRWLAVVVLGGGTTHTQVWADRVQCLLIAGIGKANDKWDDVIATRRRHAAHTTRAPRGLRARRERHQPRRRSKPLLTFQSLSLGRGALMMNTQHATAGSANTAAASSLVPATSLVANASTAGLLPPAAGSVSLSGAVLHEVTQTHSNSANTTNNVSANTVPAVPGGAGLDHLYGSGAGVGGRDLASTNSGGATGAFAVAGGEVGVDASMLNAAGMEGGNNNTTGATNNSNSPGAAAGGPIVGLVLPRVAGDVRSFECFYVPPSTAATSAEVTASSPNTTSRKRAALRQRRHGEVESVMDVHPIGAVAGHRRSAREQSPLRPQAPAATAVALRTPPLRTFLVPLVYEDQQFQLRLGCALPMASLLPAPFNLVIPKEVLTIDCGVDIRHIAFQGFLHIAFQGPVMEISFPEAPRFTAVIAVTNPYLPSSTSSWAGAERFAPLPLRAASTAASIRSPRGGGHADGGGTGTAANTVGGSPSTGGLHANGVDSAARYSSSAGNHTGLHDRNEKVQEVVLNAVRSAVGLITYPRVLRGQPQRTLPRVEVRPPPAPTGLQGRTPPARPAEDFSFLLDSDDEESPPGMMAWTMTSASLPLFTE